MLHQTRLWCSLCFALGRAMQGPKRYTPPPCLVSDLPFIDGIAISHSHYVRAMLLHISDRSGALLTGASCTRLRTTSIFTP